MQDGFGLLSLTGSSLSRIVRHELEAFDPAWKVPLVDIGFPTID